MLNELRVIWRDVLIPPWARRGGTKIQTFNRYVSWIISWIWVASGLIAGAIGATYLLDPLGVRNTRLADVITIVASVVGALLTQVIGALYFIMLLRLGILSRMLAAITAARKRVDQWSLKVNGPKQAEETPAQLEGIDPELLAALGTDIATLRRENDTETFAAMLARLRQETELRQERGISPPPAPSKRRSLFDTPKRVLTITGLYLLIALTVVLAIIFVLALDVFFYGVPVAVLGGLVYWLTSTQSANHALVVQGVIGGAILKVLGLIVLPLAQNLVSDAIVHPIMRWMKGESK